MTSTCMSPVMQLPHWLRATTVTRAWWLPGRRWRRGSRPVGSLSLRRGPATRWVRKHSVSRVRMRVAHAMAAPPLPAARLLRTSPPSEEGALPAGHAGGRARSGAWRCSAWPALTTPLANSPPGSRHATLPGPKSHTQVGRQHRPGGQDTPTQRRVPRESRSPPYGIPSPVARTSRGGHSGPPTGSGTSDRAAVGAPACAQSFARRRCLDRCTTGSSGFRWV